MEEIVMRTSSLARSSSGLRFITTNIAALAAFVAIAGLFAPTIAKADVVQTLDSVDIFDGSLSRPMRFDEVRTARQPLDYETSPIVSATAPGGFKTCQRAANGDLICIDSDVVSRWVTTTTRDINNVATKVVSKKELFTCASLGLDSRRGNPACLSFAVDVNDAIWIGGRKNNSAYSVIKVATIAQGGACAAPVSDLTADFDFCPKIYATGRPLITDMVVIDGEVAKAFKGPLNSSGPGVIVLERRDQVMFVPDVANPVPPLTIASGKTAWGFNGNEGLNGATLLQTQDAVKVNYIVATTDTGRILAKRTDTSAAATPVFNIPGNRNDPGISYAQCNGDVTQNYGIRARSESGRVYVSDRDCRQVLALTWFTAPSSDPSYCTPLAGPLTLCNVREDLDGQAATPNDYVDVTLSTGDVAPNGVSVAPGVPVDFNDCRPGSGKVCPIAPDGADTANEQDNQVGAYVKDVALAADSKSNMVVYRITGIPDCRSNAGLPGCDQPGVVVEIPANSGKKFLNVYPLLPELIRKQMTANDSTELLISPMYAAQAPGYTFEAFFGRTEPGVYFTGNFEITVDVGDLVGSKLGCGQDDTAPKPDILWDIMTTISERYPVASQAAASGTLQTATAPASPATRFVDMLVNTSCENPTAGAGARWSLYPYNLEINPTGFEPSGLLAGNAPYGADVYALLLRSLYYDLRFALDSTARTYVAQDGNAAGTTPLSTSDGNTLSASWLNGDDKLTKCITAAYDKQSAADQACQAFTSQLTGFRSELDRVVPANADRANRVGELKARVKVIFHVLNDHFLPSIPLEGFNP